jgi:hypothetical protein
VPGKRQWPSGGTPEGGQAKKLRDFGQTSYATDAREGFRLAIVSADYPGDQISRDNFADIQRAIGRLVDELPEEGFTPTLVDSYWSKGRPLWSAMMSRLKSG